MVRKRQKTAMDLRCDYACGSATFAPAISRFWFRSQCYAVFPRCCAPASICRGCMQLGRQRGGTYPQTVLRVLSLIVLITAGFYFAELFTSTPLESIYFPFVECTLAVIALLILAFEPHNAKVRYGLSISLEKVVPMVLSLRSLSYCTSSD